MSERTRRAAVTVQRTAEESDRRYIYNGDLQSRVSGYAMRPNRRGSRRRVSTFNIIVALFAAGIGIVVYINNIITVNQLAFTVNQLQVKYDAVMSMNAALRAEVNNKSARERIGTIAAEQLQLHYPKEQPAWFTVDDEKLKKLRSK